MPGVPPRPSAGVAALVAELRDGRWLTSERVAAAFAAAQRELFVPEVSAEEAYRNEAVVVKRDSHGIPISSSSQPSVMARMLELLEPRPGDRVLEVGAGTGYNAALLRELVGPRGRVTTIDVDPTIASRARRALRRSGHRAKVLLGDGRAGHPPGAPYDRIIVTASADAVASAWIGQLSPEGRLVLPLRLGSDAVWQAIPALERHGLGLHSVGLTWGGFMDLHAGTPPPPGGQPQLSAGYSAAHRHEMLARLSGPGVQRLTAGGRRELLRAVLARDRQRRLQSRTVVRRFPDPPWPLLALLCRLPPARRVELHRSGRVALGLVERDGSAALASFREALYGPGVPIPRPGEPRRERWWIEVYGPRPPLAELERALAVRVGTFRIEVPGSGGPPVLSWS